MLGSDPRPAYAGPFDGIAIGNILLILGNC